MPLTAQTCIDRLVNGPRNAFAADLTADQQLQRLCEVIERFYEKGTWRGVHAIIDLQSSTNLISLPADYLRLDALGEPTRNSNIPIRGLSWQFIQSGPGIQDWTKYGQLVALDQGDTAGIRQYLLTGQAVNNDPRLLKGLARKRFNWITDVSTAIIPDCYQAIRIGVLALGMEDEAANDASDAMFAKALAVLDSSLTEFESVTSMGSVQMDFSIEMGDNLV